MRRFVKTSYMTDKGRTLVELNGDGTATVVPSSVSADELDELATACQAAAEELRRKSEAAKVRIAE